MSYPTAVTLCFQKDMLEEAIPCHNSARDQDFKLHESQEVQELPFPQLGMLCRKCHYLSLRKAHLTSSALASSYLHETTVEKGASQPVAKGKHRLQQVAQGAEPGLSSPAQHLLPSLTVPHPPGPHVKSKSLPWRRQGRNV